MRLAKGLAVASRRNVSPALSAAWRSTRPERTCALKVTRRAHGTTALYDELVRWYHLIDPPQDHADEAECFRQAFERAVRPPLVTLLDLGAGAGHNVLHLKRRFTCTLVDVSEAMLSRSRQLNPECEHIVGDMRTVHLGRSFDAVLAHDAIMYMTSEDGLAAAITTAYEHVRPGGAAIFALDATRETFVEETEQISSRAGGLSVEGLAWSWDPDPADQTFLTDYAFMLRDGNALRVVHDRHVEGLFPEATWRRLLAAAGFETESLARPIGDSGFDTVFLCKRPL